MNQRKTFVIEYEYMDGVKKRNSFMRLSATDEEEARELARKYNAYGQSITILSVEEVIR